jgi:hypothetical protein
MVTSRELADAALVAARQFLADQREQITARAGGDLDALIQAAQLVRGAQAQQPARGRSAEHIAFTLLPAAFAEALAAREENA